MTLFKIMCLLFFVSQATFSGVMTSAEMTSAGTMTQYCDFEVFEAGCSASHEVVVMAAASYGRRETGRCLPRDSVIESLRHDPRYYGCSADVLRLADHKCSGRRRCSVAIPDSDFERVTPCYKDSRKYLEAKYDCVKVVEADRSCVLQVSTSTLHISSSQLSATSTDTRCGSVGQPWTLRAPTGQHIRVHLLDFTSQNTDNTQQQQRQYGDRAVDDGDERGCREYGYVDDTTSSAAAARRRRTVICGDQRRDKLVLRSNSNVVHVVFNRPPPTNDTNLNFLLRFYAVGCLDVRPPDDAWMRRVGADKVEIGCYMSRQVWVLRCVDNQFVGVIGNCTQHLADYNEEVIKEVMHHESVGNSKGIHVLALAAVSSVGLAICLTVICVGLLCLRSQKRNDGKYHRQWAAEDYTSSNNKFNAALTNTSDDSEGAAAATAAMMLYPAASQHHV